MEFNEIIKYLAENLELEVTSNYEGNYSNSNNQEVKVKLKIGDAVISESEATVYIE